MCAARQQSPIKPAAQIWEAWRSIAAAVLRAFGRAAFFLGVLACLAALLVGAKAHADEYYWSNGIIISDGGATATGSVNGVGYTITSSNSSLTSHPGHWNVENFPDSYKIPGDTGAGPAVDVFVDNQGGTYTLTFDSPVESPLISISSLGQPTLAIDFTFGSSVNLLWTANVIPASGSVTSVTGQEGYIIAQYPGTVSSVTFTPGNTAGNDAMMLMVGFAVSTTPPTITAPGGTAGASSSAISVAELQTAVGDFDANKAVNWSIVGGADQGLFTINSSTGVLSFSTAPDFLSPSDQDQNNVYEVQIRASDLQQFPQSATQTVNVTVTDATAPVVSSVSVPANDIYLNTENLDFSLNLSEQVTVDTTSGTPRISLDIGGVTKYADYQSGSGSSSLLFRYTVSSSDVDADGISINSLSVNGGTIQDAAGNNLNVTLNSVGNTSSVLVGHGSASQLAITTQPVAAANGAALGTQPVLEIRDVDGNVVTSDSSTQITATIGSGASGTLGGTATATASSGVVTFSNLTLTGLTSETYTLSFDDAGALTAVASSNLTLTGPGAASKIVLVTQPVFGPNGQLLTTQPVLQVQDAQGNVVTGDSSTQVTVSIGSGAGGTLGGTQTVTASNGVITFTDLTFAGATAENYTLAFSSTGGLTGATVGGLVTAGTVPTAPQNVTATSADGQIEVVFTPPQSDGGVAISDYQYTLDGGQNWVSASTTTSPFTISSVDNGQTYQLGLRAVNSVGAGPSSAFVSVAMPSPQQAFEEALEAINATLVQEAQRSLQSSLAVNQRMVRGARDRFVSDVGERSSCGDGSASAGCEAGVVSRNAVPFDIDGSFNLSGTTVSTRGNFFEQTGNYDGTQRRLFFGDFDVQHDSDTDSTTATLSARVAWEQMTSDTTMLGYFVGGELATSNISGAFEGDQERVALTVGGYAVHQLADELFLDGFLSYGIGRNNLEMANDVLALTSDYTTRTATAGAALSGVYEYERYELRPELAFSYGKTWIGNVGFTGRAYGLVDDTLSLDAGEVSIANLTLRPEVIWALDAGTVAESNSQLSFAPRAICERTLATTRTENCGGGAELGLSSTSDDGLSTADFRVIMDRVGSSNRSSFAFNLEHRF